MTLVNNAIMVSVFCYVYNHESYLDRTLEGFISQKTNFRFEIIVHDDASTDKSKEIIKKYEDKYPDIVKPIYQKVNIYHNKSINRLYDYMIPKAHGKYIALCEGDDYWCDEKKLQKQFDYMEAHPECSLVVHDALRLDISKNKFQKYNNLSFDEYENILSTSQVITSNYSFPLNSLFFRKNFYVINEGFIRSISMFDYALKTMLAMEGSVCYLNSVMSVYRKGTEGSWTQRVAKDPSKLSLHLTQSIDILEKICSYYGLREKEAFDEEILSRRFSIEVLNRNKKVFKCKEFKGLFQAMPIEKKIKVFLKIYFYRIINLYRSFVR